MNRSNSLLRLSLAAAIAMASGAAFAQTTPPVDQPVQKQEPMTPPAHSQGDSKNDVMQARFDALDKNHDGFLSKDEVGKDRQLAENFASWDSNSDGKISLSEFESHA